jgi:hypothetical protein
MVHHAAQRRRRQTRFSGVHSFHNAKSVDAPDWNKTSLFPSAYTRTALKMGILPI